MSDASIRIRDVVRGDVHELGPEEPALRASYDLFHPAGPVHLRPGSLVEWLENDSVRTSRVVPTALGDVHPGERVLVRVAGDDEWWLCDVETVAGTTGTTHT